MKKNTKDGLQQLVSKETTPNQVKELVKPRNLDQMALAKEVEALCPELQICSDNRRTNGTSTDDNILF